MFREKLLGFAGLVMIIFVFAKVATFLFGIYELAKLYDWYIVAGSGILAIAIMALLPTRHNRKDESL